MSIYLSDGNRRLKKLAGRLNTIDNALDPASENPVQNKTLYNPVTFAENERQKSKNLFNINKLTLSQGGTVSNNQINLTQYYALSSNNFTDLVNLKPNTNYVFSCKSTATEPASTQIAISSSLETVYWYENTSKSFTQEEINAMTTFYIYGNRDNSASVISEIQIEEGTEATEYQPYNGAIVHEKDMEPVVIYDKNTNNTIGGVAYTDGIKIETTVSIPNVQDYKKIIIYSERSYTMLCTICDIESALYTNFSSVNMDIAGDYLVIHCFEISRSQNNLVFSKGGYMYVRSLADFTLESSTSNNLIYRIEGYK